MSEQKEVTEEMLQAGMKAAVEHGLVPKYSISEDQYVKNWEAVKAIIAAALEKQAR